ncbi:hypothetical protein C7B61_17795, partial [filamentous cyanobacterium CCP1]
MSYVFTTLAAFAEDLSSHVKPVQIHPLGATHLLLCGIDCRLRWQSSNFCPFSLTPCLSHDST